MGVTFWKQGVWVLLFFSLALNIGFVFTAASWKIRPGFNPPPHGSGPVLEILDRMDLVEGVKEKVAKFLKKMDADHRDFVRLLFKEEEKVLTLIGRPGNLDMEMVAPLIETHSRIFKKSAMNKAGYIIEIRKLLGREKSLYLISEMKKDFRKRMHKDKPQG